MKDFDITTKRKKRRKEKKKLTTFIKDTSKSITMKLLKILKLEQAFIKSKELKQ